MQIIAPANVLVIDKNLGQRTPSMSSICHLLPRLIISINAILLILDPFALQ
jgi:hypothetical protein